MQQLIPQGKSIIEFIDLTENRTADNKENEQYFQQCGQIHFARLFKHPRCYEQHRGHKAEHNVAELFSARKR